MAESVIIRSCRTHMQDLKDVTNNVHYENFRCKKLAGVVGPVAGDPKVVTSAPSRSVIGPVTRAIAIWYYICHGS